MMRFLLLVAGAWLHLTAHLNAAADTPTGQTRTRWLEAQRSATGDPTFAPDAGPCYPGLFAVREGGHVQGQPIGASQDFPATQEDGSTVRVRLLRIIDHHGGIASMSWSGDGRLIATSTETGVGAASMVRVWDVASGQCLASTLLAPTTVFNASVPIGLLGSLSAVAVPARLARPAGPDALLLWRFRGGARPAYLPWPGTVAPDPLVSYSSVEVSPGQDLLSLVVHSPAGSEVLVYRVRTSDVHSRIGCDRRLFIRDFRFSRDGALVAMAIENRNAPERTDHVVIATPMLGSPRIVIASPDPPIVSVAFSGDGQYLATGASRVRDGRSLRVSMVGIRTSAHPTGQTTDLNGTSPPLRIWDASTGREVAAIDGPDTGTVDLDWSPDNRMIAAAFGDHSIVVWQWPSRAVVLRVRPAPRGVPSLCARFSPDGRMLAICTRTSLALFAIE